MLQKAMLKAAAVCFLHGELALRGRGFQVPYRLPMNLSISLSSIVLAACVFAGCGAAPANVGEAEAEAVAEAPAPPVWGEDFVASIHLAQKQDRAILLNFTGSDWSPPCAHWRNQILETAEFADYAAANLILIELDYPMHREQVPEVVRQNQVLQALFAVDGFPTLVLLQPDGSEIERMSGVLPERARDFIDWLRTRP
jgi:thioredoxin-related protein